MTTVVEFYISEKDKKDCVKQLSTYFDTKYAVIIAEGLHDFTKQYCQSNNIGLSMASSIYKDQLNNLMYNFKQDNNTIKDLINKIHKNKYNPYNLVYLTPSELDKDNWEKIITRRNNTEYKLNNLPTIEWKPCQLCKNTKYFFYQLQTRSADEPMTTFYICKECDKRYKVNN
jgi:DNA-directed RNA polymerase subunit M/transcription elongation factor TFIIS